MTQQSIHNVSNLIDEWWVNEETDLVITRARLVLLIETRVKGDLSNYRPISLLNALYKVRASIIQARIPDTLDKRLQHTQYGFRRKKGTTDAIRYIR